MEARLELTGATAFEGMYDNVRPLMVTGALLGCGSAVCFVLAPPAAPILAAGAFCVGYLPWFATTVTHYERETDAAAGIRPTGIFSRDDMANPLALIGKGLIMAVVVPLSALVFFIPYPVYAGVPRPLGRAFV